jgi:glutathione S-transferase
VVRAAAPPEGTFFPDDAERSDVNELMAEAMSEADTAYRPNVSAYTEQKDKGDEDAKKTTALDNLAIFSGGFGGPAK